MFQILNFLYVFYRSLAVFIYFLQSPEKCYFSNVLSWTGNFFFSGGELLKSIALGGHIYIEVKCKYTLKCLFTST